LKIGENITNILSRKKNETPLPEFDQSKIRELDNTVPIEGEKTNNPSDTIEGEKTNNPTGHIEVGGKKQRTKKRRYKSKK
jgi:hypothetical protein